MIRKVARNTIFLSASQIIGRAIGFFYFIFLARVLAVETFGAYTFTLGFVYNFLPVANFGLERLILRDLPRKPGKTQFYFSRLVPLKILLSIGAYGLALFLGFILGQPSRQIIYFAIFGLLIIPRTLIFLIVNFQAAKEKMEYMAISNILIIALSAILGVLFVFLGFSISWILLAYFLANCLVCVGFLARLSAWNLKLEWVVDKKFWFKVLSQSWVFAAMLILAVLYLRLSLVLVGFLQGPYLTGIYGSAFKFAEAGILIPQSLALALFPLSSKLFVSNKRKLKEIYKKGLGVLLLGGLVVGVVMFFGSKYIIPLIYGDQYAGAIPVFSVLGLAMTLFFMNVLPSNIILNSPQVKRFLPWAFLNFLIAGALGLALIPKYSIIGAAWMVVGGEMAGLIINNLFVWKILKNTK